MKQNNEIVTDWYNTSESWLFNNGQYCEKIPIKQKDIFELQIIDNKITGLYHRQQRDTGGGTFNNSFRPIASIPERFKPYFEQLKSQHESRN